MNFEDTKFSIIFVKLILLIFDLLWFKFQDEILTVRRNFLIRPLSCKYKMFTTLGCSYVTQMWLVNIGQMLIRTNVINWHMFTSDSTNNWSPLTFCHYNNYVKLIYLIFLVRLVRLKNKMLPHLCPIPTILTPLRETSALKSFAIKKRLLVQG